MDYKDKLRLAKEALDSGSYDKETIEYIFPELKESENERIRLELIRDIDIAMPIETAQKYITWLEKQGEQRINRLVWKHWKDGIAGNGEGKLIYLVKMNNTYRLTSCLGFECDYIELSELDNLLSEKQGEQKPADKIQLGKKYKCIASPRYSTFMLGKIYKPEDKFLCSLMSFFSDFFEPIEESEQKPVYEMKTPEESLGIDSDTYTKIVDECIFGEQNPAWSEEDKAILEKCIGAVKASCYSHSFKSEAEDWLKSLKDRVQPQQQEWNEEDEKMIDAIYSCVDSHYDGLAKTSLLIWLKSLKPQKQWKPSDEQIQALEYQVHSTFEGSWQYKASKELLEQLKKL